MQFAIAAGAEAAARGTLLTCDQVLHIFNWHQALKERKEQNLDCTNMPNLMDILFKSPREPVPPSAGTNSQ